MTQTPPTPDVRPAPADFGAHADRFHFVACHGGCGRVTSQSKRVGEVIDYTLPSARVTDESNIVWRQREPQAWRCVVCGPFS